MTPLQEFLARSADGDLVAWSQQTLAAEQFGLTRAQVEQAILETGLMPARYRRNRAMLSTAQQLVLFRTRVAVIGCGGLGGYLVEELARLGVGTIVALDPDVFEEHNLNRQILATPAALGRNKARAAVSRIAEVNPACTVVPIERRFTPEHAAELFDRVDVVADGVDSVDIRLELSEACARLGIPLVSGAIAGWYGQVTTVLPGDQTIRLLYAHHPTGRGIETRLGNPSFTPAVVASLEAAEVCKLLVGAGTTLRHRVLLVNLLDMEIESLPLE